MATGCSSVWAKTLSQTEVSKSSKHSTNLESRFFGQRKSSKKLSKVSATMARKITNFFKILSQTRVDNRLFAIAPLSGSDTKETLRWRVSLSSTTCWLRLWLCMSGQRPKMIGCLKHSNFLAKIMKKSPNTSVRRRSLRHEIKSDGNIYISRPIPILKKPKNLFPFTKNGWKLLTNGVKQRMIYCEGACRSMEKTTTR